MKSSVNKNGLVFSKEQQEINSINSLKELMYLAEHAFGGEYRIRVLELSKIIRNDLDLLKALEKEAKIISKSNMMNCIDIHITEYVFLNGKAYKNSIYTLLKNRN